MNKIVLVGRVTKEPEMKVLEESGKTVTRLTLAVDRPYKNNQGEKEVDFIPVVLWGKKGEVASEHLTKGSTISVSGRLQLGSYENKEGAKRYKAEVIAEEFHFVVAKKIEKATTA